jgi:hypothetical protein
MRVDRATRARRHVIALIAGVDRVGLLTEDGKHAAVTGQEQEYDGIEVPRPIVRG